jgi:DNA-binding NarL/FixJ family response regulator
MTDPVAARVPMFVVDDQPATLKGVLKLLSAFRELDVVGTALSGEAALASLPSSGARVALVDLELPGMDGLELVTQLKRAEIACELLVLTSFFDEARVFEAMRRGAAGYLVKGISAERLQHAIHEVDRGGTVIEPRLARVFWAYFKGVQAPAASPESGLSPNELQLLALVARGLSNVEAASVLGISRRSVRTQLQHVYDKLGVRSHVDAVVVALRRGLIQL